MAIVVARRSWLEIFLRNTGKGREKERREVLTKQPSSTAEIR